MNTRILTSLAALVLVASVVLGAMLPITTTPTARAASGVPNFLVGINKPSLEYSCHGSHVAYADFLTMKQVWHANTVRLPLSSGEWLNQAGANCPTYRATVEQAVYDATRAGLYVILALAWTNPFQLRCAPGYNPAGAGYPLPSVPDATAFWTQVATDFTQRNIWHIGYEVYSEPHDVTWKQWHDGGTLTVGASYDRCAGTYQAMGMQAMATLVTGIVGWHRVYVSGNSWGGDLSGASAGYAVNTGKSRVYDIHFYPGPNSSNPANWPGRFGNLALTQPVTANEFGDFPNGGCADNGAFNNQTMPYMAAHLRGMSAWAWNTDVCGLVTSYTTGSPSAYGKSIHDFYVAHY